MEVTVIGAGAIGLTTAYRLAREGHDVTLVEKADVGAGSSQTNAGWITPSLSAPVASPGAIITAAKWMMRGEGPVTIHWQPRIGYLRFLAALLLNCRPAVYSRGVAAMADLTSHALQSFARLRDECGGFETSDGGMLLLFRDEHSREHYAREIEVLTSAEMPAARPLSPEQSRSLEPELSAEDHFALFCEQDRMVDPVLFIRGMAIACRSAGVRFVERTVVKRISLHGNGARVETSSESIDAERIIISAGAASSDLTAMVGYRLPLTTGKGYVVDLLPQEMSFPLYLSAEKIAISPFPDRLRLAGVIEFGSSSLAMSPAKAQGLISAAQHYFRQPLGEAVDARCGLRPMTPDGLPVIAPLPHAEKIIVATGHGMLGVTLAPLTSELVSDIVAGRRSATSLTPFSATRFAR